MKSLQIALAFMAATLVSQGIAVAGDDGDSQKPEAVAEELAAKNERVRNAAEGYAPPLRRALKEQAQAGILKEFEWERIGAISRSLCYLDDEEFVAVLKPVAADEEIPAELRAVALADLISSWGGRHDSEGACPSREQLSMTDQLLPLFPGAAEKAVVARTALLRASMEFPTEAAKWLQAHPGIWTGEAREKLVGEMFEDWGLFGGESPELADAELLGVKDYRLVGKVLGGRGGAPEGIERMWDLTSGVKDQAKAADLRRGMVEGAGESLARMDYDEGRKWLEACGLTEAEICLLAESADLFAADMHGEPSPLNQWIGWLSEELPPEKFTAKVEELGERWEDMPWALEELKRIAQPAARAAAVKGFCRKESDPARIKAAQELLK